MRTLSTRCCVAGGGPAGMMLGLLLARAGVDVVVLEKHADFLRDFRGDTIHPSTLEVMHELGLLEAFLALPHTQVRELAGIIGGERIPIADFGHLPVRCPFIALMPQWDFLDFLAGHARRYPGFALRMSTGAVGLIDDGRRGVGVSATAPGGPPQGRARGLAAFRDEVARLADARADASALRDWEDVKLLTVRVDRLARWFRPGVLCLGDAAHAMSPVGGVGINLAIQDAVAAANLLAAPLREGRVSAEDLARVQRRREWPTRVTQRVQVLVQNRIVRRVLQRRRPLRPPPAVRLLARFPRLRRLPGRLIGLGVRPEHVRV